MIMVTLFSPLVITVLSRLIIAGAHGTFDNIATFFVKDSQARVTSGPYNRLQRAVSGAPFCAARKSWVHKDGIHYLHLLHDWFGI